MTNHRIFCPIGSKVITAEQSTFMIDLHQVGMMLRWFWASWWNYWLFYLNAFPSKDKSWDLCGGRNVMVITADKDGQLGKEYKWNWETLFVSYVCCRTKSIKK